MTSSFNTASVLVNAHTHLPTEPHLYILQRRAGEPILSGQTCSVGIHPKDAAGGLALVSVLEEQLRFPEVIAVGETGLDSGLDVSIEQQEVVYIVQLQLAAKYNLPVILHCVHAWDRCRFLHATYAPKQPLIFHGFARPSIVQSVLDYPPAMISLGHRLLHSVPLQTCAEALPLERLLLETDNADVELSEIYAELARLKFVSLRSLTKQLTINFKRVFEHVELA